MLMLWGAFTKAQTAEEHYEIGLESMYAEAYSEARSSFNEAITLDPDNESFYLARAELVLMENQNTFNQADDENSIDYLQALKDFEKALELSPTSFEGLYGKARLNYMFLKFRESQQDYDAALKAAYFTEDKVLALGGRGACQYRLGEVDGAMRDLDRAINYDPNNSIILNEIAMIYINQGEIKLAIKALNTILKKNPNDQIALANMGFTALKAEKYEKALKIYDDVINQFGKRAFLLSNRSFALMNLGRYDEALEDINLSIELNPKNSFAYKYKGMIYLELKDKENACKSLMTAKDLGYTTAYGNEVIDLLRKNCLSTNTAPSGTKRN